MNRRKFNERRGVTAVEMALTLPVLILLIFGAYELCRANMMKHTAEAATYEAARVAIIPGAQTAEVESVCRQVLATAGISRAVIEIDPPNLQTPSDLISVTISVDYGENTTLAPFFMDNRVLVRRCELSREIRGGGN